MIMTNELAIGRRPLRRAVCCGILIAATGLGAGCGGGEASSPTGSTARPGGPPGSGRPQLPTMAVSVAPAARGAISTYYRATASLDPDKEADVLARVSGIIERILAEEGDRVEAGQILLRIVDDEYRTRKTLAEVEVERQRARFERARKIFDQGLSSAEDFDTIRTELASAEAELELAALELSYTTVRAPFTGRVVQRLVDQGRTVSNGTPLFSLADTHRLLARVFVPAKELGSIRVDQPVELTVPSSGDRLSGRIDLVSPVVDPESGTIKVTVEVRDYPPTTRPGDFVEVSIVTDQHEDGLLVPRVAVVSERGQQSVYVVDDDTAHQRPVEVGFEDDDSAEILEGLDEGERVVVQGQRALRDGQPVTVLDALELDQPPVAETTTPDREG
jgi:membrane fusion protein (multidrug efflux system)